MEQHMIDDNPEQAASNDEAGLNALLQESKQSTGKSALEELLKKAETKIAEKQQTSASRQQSSEQPSEQASEQSSGKLSREERRAMRQAKSQAQEGAAPTTGKANLLIAHSDMTQRSVLEMTFISEGYNVTVVENGKEALIHLKTNMPDILLLDADMEKLTGMDVCFRIRKIDRFEKIPVIIMTDGLDDRTQTMVKMCLANDFFPKTQKNIELKAKVRKLLDKSNSDTETSQTIF